ncbi:hypothetical protein EVJ24_14970 [Exiguobacterium sp. SH1S21]|uniref:hypothetical protein n=1 Tax=Exiguobacterium sp. SH1S21 TaxID=2510953 RepID=UPI00103EB836|nr:hypothetical protein [Exiguobacterium sp. SH1S21]TCI50308.1 hypothetical protein EVJ24_14970 [Exiguobacterium sp. SH1S21]
MKKVEGIVYTLEGVSDRGLMAEAMFDLHNLQSKQPGTIENIKYVAGGNRVIVVAYRDISQYIEDNSHVWEVVSTYPVNIITSIKFDKSEDAALKTMDEDEQEFYFTNFEYK